MNQTINFVLHKIIEKRGWGTESGQNGQDAMEMWVLGS